MSRSYREPIYKDGGHWKKQVHSRAYRSRCKQITKIFAKDTEVFLLIYGGCFLDEEDHLVSRSWHPSPIYPHKWEITELTTMRDWYRREEKVHFCYSYHSRGQMVDNMRSYTRAKRK